MLVHAGLGIDAARQSSPTSDEYWHLPFGLYILQSGDFSADPINPPPVRIWAALPNWFAGVRLPETPHTPSPFEVGDAFLDVGRARYRELFFGGRMMILLLGIATGALLALGARLWFGDAAGAIASVLWFACPTLLANSIVVTHDLPLTAAVVATLAAAAWFRHAPGWNSAATLGVLLGVAQLTKLTAVLLVPLAPLWWILLPPGSQRKSWWQIAAQWAVVYALAWLIVAGGYGFQGVGRADDTLTTAPVLREMASLLPEPYRRGWQRVRGDLQSAHPVFLDGEWKNEGGFPTYYLMALAYKLALGTLTLIFAAVAMNFGRNQSWASRRIALALLVVALGFIVPASRSPNQIGIRYILPAFPCLMLLASQAAGWCDRQRTPWMRRLVIFAVMSVPLGLRFHPHHLTYFNELAGGPIGGRQHLVDSNLDWGQDLHAAAEWVKSHVRDEAVSVAYFGTIPPHTVGLTGLPPRQFDPQPGWSVVSANYVQGRPHALRLSDGTFLPVGLDAFGYFRYFEPKAQIGYSIDVYYLSPEDIARFHAARAEAK